MSIQKVVDETFHKFKYERKKAYRAPGEMPGASVYSPTVIITLGSKPKSDSTEEVTVQEQIQNFLGQMLMEQGGIYLLSLGGSGEGSISIESDENLVKSIGIQLQRVIEQIQKEGYLFTVSTSIHFCFVLDGHDETSLFYKQTIQNIQKLMPKIYLLDFYIFATYNDLEFDAQKLNKGIHFLKELENFHRTNPIVTSVVLGMKKQNAKMDGSEETREKRISIISFLILLIAQNKFFYCEKEKMYSFGITKMSEYDRTFWNGLMLDLVAQFWKTDEGADIHLLEEDVRELDILLHSVERKLDLSAMEYALMNPITPEQVSRKKLKEVERNAFGTSLRYYFEEMAAALREKTMDAAETWQKTRLEKNCDTIKKLEWMSQKVKERSSSSHEESAVNYELSYNDEIAFDKEQIREFVLQNIYELEAVKRERDIKSEVLIKISKGIQSSWQEAEKNRKRQLEMKEELIGTLKGGCVPIKNPLTMEDTLRQIKADMVEQNASTNEEITLLFCQAAEKLLTQENIRQMFLYKENFKTICKRMEEMISPYCVDFKDDSISEIFLAGSKKEVEFGNKIAAEIGICADFMEVSCLDDIWLLSCKEIEACNLECVFLNRQKD